MKQYLSTFAGSAICGGFAFGIWPELWKTYGLMGGWLAATLIIGIMWYMNHYHGLIKQDADAAFVDMGLAIAICGVSRDAFLYGFHTVVDSLPTILLVIVGATLGGLFAAKVEVDMEKD